jgi:hypothetical protein
VVPLAIAPSADNLPGRTPPPTKPKRGKAGVGPASSPGRRDRIWHGLDDTLPGLAAASPGTAWAVSSYISGHHKMTLILHWEGMNGRLERQEDAHPALERHRVEMTSFGPPEQGEAGISQVGAC